MQWGIISKIYSDKMAELATNEVIKIVIAVLVLAVVIFGLVSGYRNYIVPYFEDLGPSNEKKDLDSQYYKELVKKENEVAILTSGDKEQYLIIKGEKTRYYWKKGDIKEDNGKWYALDKKLGITDKNGRIAIFEESLAGNPEIEALKGAEKVGNAFYKKRGN